VFGSLGVYILGTSHASGTATLTLSPASSTVALGSTVAVTITENSGATGVNAVEADLAYDQTKLQYVSTSTTASPFTIVANNTGGSGSVDLANASPTSQTGAQTVATVTFTTIGLGAAPVTFANSSQIVEPDSTDDTGTLTGATYTVTDQTAPSVPAGLSATTRTATSITLGWTASTDNVGVTGYKIFRGGTQVGTSSTTSYTNTGLTPSSNYSYTILAVDAAGNSSAQSGPLATSTTADTTTPSVPTGLTVGTRSLTSIQFSWTASTDNVGVTGYKIFRGGTQVGTSSTTSYTDTGLTTNTSYSYTVAASDAAGNASAQSSSSSFSTLADTTAPSVPAGLSSPSQTSTTISLSWAASTDNVGISGYKIYRGGTLLTTTTGTTYTDTGLTDGTSYSYAVAAYDATGNASAQSSAKSFQTALVAGDVSGDGHVNISDLSILAATWQSTTDLRADLNHDGVVNISDLSIMAANWGK
jgi:chitodextrinase